MVLFLAVLSVLALELTRSDQLLFTTFNSVQDHVSSNEGPTGYKSSTIKKTPFLESSNHIKNGANQADSNQVKTTTTSLSNGSLSRKLRLSFFSDDSPTQTQPASICVRIRPDEQGRFGFNVKVSGGSCLHVLCISPAWAE